MNIDAIVAQNQIKTDETQGQSALGKDDFLKLMVMQMQQQDPLNPMDNQAMLSQMAQFSSLEQMSNLNKTLTDSNSTNTFLQAATFLGKEVAVVDPNAEPGEDATVVSKVQALNYSADGPIFTLDNGMAVGLENLLGVANPQQAN